ncbi:MAG: ribosome assembly cofactor RimP [Rikenellaceae bacterium]
MIDVKKIVASAEAKLEGSDMFVVHCTCSPSNEVELFVDSDTKVSIDECVKLSRAIEEDFDREVEDFALTVASAGVGEPIRLLRQYPKLIGRSVEVLLTSGVKVIGQLLEATEEGVKVSYDQKQVVESGSGKKKKQIVEVVEFYPFSDIKFVKEFLDFK